MKKPYVLSWRSHDRNQLFHTAAIFHVAAGPGCARAVHAAIHVAAENDTFENTNKDIGNNSKCCDLAPKAAT